jgi:hypothetical protein
MLSEEARKRCEEILDQWGVEPSQIVIVRQEDGVDFVFTFGPNEGAVTGFEDERTESEMIEYLTDLGVVVREG